MRLLYSCWVSCFEIRPSSLLTSLVGCMASILEMAADIVAAHASTTKMSKEELVAELADGYGALHNLEKIEETGAVSEQEQGPAVSRKKAFGRDKGSCMICGKGFKPLSRHLKTSHEMTASDYRKQFDIPRSRSRAAKSYSEKRRQMAIDRGTWRETRQNPHRADNRPQGHPRHSPGAPAHRNSKASSLSRCPSAS